MKYFEGISDKFPWHEVLLTGPLNSLPSIHDTCRLDFRREFTDVRATPQSENIGRRVTSWAHLEWTPSRLVNCPEQIRPHTARLFEGIPAEKPHPEMGYRSCLGIIRLAEQYSAGKIKAAAERALRAGAYRYQSVKLSLKNALDQ
jgi:transposase